MRVFKAKMFQIQENDDSSIEFHVDTEDVGPVMHALLQARPRGSCLVNTPKGVLRVHVHGGENVENVPKPHVPIEPK